MMKMLINRLLISIALLSLSIIVPAQNLPVLPSDPAITTGTLPNGLTYYIAKNTSAKGRADFALVQKTGTRTISDTSDVRTIRLAKDVLSSLPRMETSTPQAWLSSHGVVADSDGFVNVSSDATVFRFNDVVFSSGKDVQDSTLLILLTIVDRCSNDSDSLLTEWYSPSDQAIIVAGDVNPSELASKMRSMSYMTPSRPSLPRKEYKWENSDTVIYQMRKSQEAGISSVNVTWRLPRAPHEYMNTIQPAIYDRFINEMGYIAERRIELDLRRRGVPVADVICVHRSSADGPGDEYFSTTVYVQDKDVLDAAGALGRAFGTLDASSVGIDEYCVARQHYLHMQHVMTEGNFKENSDYVERCISAFLRNSSLASPSEKLAFHLSRSMSDEEQLRLFNDMAEALLDPTSNLTVTCVCSDPSYSESDVKRRFEAAWSDASLNPSSLDAFYNGQDIVWPGYGPKVKLKSSKTDPLSGGQIWEFTNGFKVLYKKMDTSDKTYWTMALNGGYGSIEDLEDGEGAFVGDYLGLCRIGGLEGTAFRDLLMSKGMTFDTKVGLTKTQISGKAPADSTERVIQLLLALSNGREADDEAFRSYVSGENLHLEHLNTRREARLAAIDSIMCPGYIYSKIKTSGKLGLGLADKAEAFYKSQSGKMNDGMLVIITDMDEAELKKMLLNYVGAFRTEGSALRRPSIRYQPISGWATHTLDGNTESIDIVMSAKQSLTIDSYMTAAVAALILEKGVSNALVDTGMYSTVASNFHTIPQERLNFIISVEPLAEDRYASYVDAKGSIEALAIVRDFLSDVSNVPVSDQILNFSKEFLKNYISERLKDPDYWMDAVSRRYIDGKDFTSNYAQRLDAVTSEQVKRLLSDLYEGSKVEYVVK